jgi:hypothetical protein
MFDTAAVDPFGEIFKVDLLFLDIIFGGIIID